MQYAIEDFIPDWLRAHLDALSQDDREAVISHYGDAVQQTLKQLQDMPLNTRMGKIEDDDFSLRLGSSNLFVNVNKSIWTAVKYAGPAILAASLSPALLVHLGISAATMPHITAGTTSAAIAALCGAFQRLDPSELDTYQAVAAAIERNRNRVLANSGADINEIQESFKDNLDLFRPKDLHAMLDQLVAKQIIEKSVVGGVEQYFLAF